MVDDMAVWGNGTYDRDKKQWKLRRKEIDAKMTIKQLSEHFHIQLPNDKKKTRPYWLRYLAQLRESIRKADPVEVEKETILARLDEMNQAELSGQDGRKAQLEEWFANRGKPVKPQAETIGAEIAEFRKIYTDNQYKNSLTEFQEVITSEFGNVSIHEFNITHYRHWLAMVVKNHKGSRTTSWNKIKNVKTFLGNLETNFSLSLGFIRNVKLHELKEMVSETDRNILDEQWTVEEIKKAYEVSKQFPLARFSLLMGLNCGCYDSDLKIGYFNPAKIQNGYYISGRAKLVWNGKQKGRIGQWKLWKETLEAVQAVQSATDKQLRNQFDKLREVCGITKTQKGLRKTVAQWIQDEFSEPLSLQFRNAGANDTQYISYASKRSKKAVATLEAATDWVYSQLF